jgi:hypothetical protein
MFVVSEAEAAAIRTAFDRGGEFSAAVELRRLFPGVIDMADAKACARTIAGWAPLRPVRLPSIAGLLGPPAGLRAAHEAAGPFEQPNVPEPPQRPA